MAKTKFGVKDVADVTFWKIGTKEPVLFFESLKVSNLENAAETVYATGGKGNPRLLGWDFNRTATLTLQDALLDTKGLALLAGNEDVEEGAQTVARRQELVAIAGGAGKSKVTLAQTPVAGTVKVYKDGDYSAPVTATVTTKDVEMDTADVAVGVTVEVFYEFQTTNTAKTVTFNSSKFPGYYRVTMDTVMKNTTTGQDEPVQFVIEKAKLQPGFTFTMEAAGDPSAFDFNLDVFKSDSGDQMIRVIKYTEE